MIPAPVNFALAVERELEMARGKHTPIASVHEGYSVILEELDEFWEEVKKKKANRNNFKMLMELIQISAMAQRVAEDVVLPNNPPEAACTH